MGIITPVPPGGVGVPGGGPVTPGGPQFPLMVDLFPSSIDTAETFGTPTLNHSVSPTAIATAEAFGSAQVLATRQLFPSSIVTAETVPSPRIQVTVQPTAIPSEEAFGFFNFGILPTGIATGEAFGSVTVQNNVSLLVSGIATAEAVGTPAVGPNIAVPSIDTAEAFGTSSLQQNIHPTTIPTEEFVEGAVVTTSAVILVVEVGAIASEEAFGTASTQQSIVVSGIATGEVLGTPIVARDALIVINDGIATEEAFQDPALDPVLSPTGIASEEAFGTALIQFSQVTISPTGIASEEAFGTPIIEADIVVVGIDSEEVFGTPGITQIDQGSLGSLRYEIAYRLGDTNNQIWAITELNHYILEGYNEMLGLTLALWRRVIINDGVGEVGSQATYPLPDDFYKMDRMTWDHKRIDPLYRSEVEYASPGYETIEGEVDGYFMEEDGQGQFRLWRVPTDSGTKTIMEYYSYGIPVIDDTDNFEIPKRYVKYLRHYVMWKCLERNGPGQDFKLSAHYKERWTAGIARMISRRQSQNMKRTARFGDTAKKGQAPPHPKMPWNYGVEVK